ncbi:hypothetical protein HO173_005471 [Letharia columbiana]|uniref:Kelch repeat protein n=1 Tax=Letharia columbiana TaxID=112416 RepID=A0A8H6L5H4_9LECA|nr:uncharacterized protein HO173_005471 [Letharia columbiana]KAF6236380.1 hypothetical protein HO173_005471 [Letharia columbiana]
MLFYIFGLVFIALVAPSIASSVTDSSFKFPRQEQSLELVRRFFHGSFVIGKTLYIDGGEATRSIDGVIERAIVNSTLALDLSSSFSTSSKNNGVQIQDINKGSCPNFNYIRFWTNVAANTVYAYGGEFSYLNPWVGSTTVPLESLWSFTPSSDGGTWQALDQSSSVFSSITRPTQGSVASGDIGGFNLGGYAGNRGSQKTNIDSFIPIPGLQFYNFTSQEWSNNSATAYSPDGTAEFSGTAYVPTWGTAGLLVAFGGQISPNISQFVDGAAYLPMSNISLFDPSTQVWYYQEATGDVPSQRDRFCVVGVNGGDNSTYEIFLYGGQVGSNIYDNSSASQSINAGLDEVYVLSLPSFVWFKANYTSSDPRMFHTCNIVGNRQMLSIGGLNPSAASWSAAINDTDLFWEGVKVFDLTALQWTNHYNVTAAPYLAPSPVAAHYAAGVRYPSTWSSKNLESLFLNPTSNTSTPVEPSASASPQLETPKKRNRTAAGVGGAVGGVAALAFLGLSVYLLARKRANENRRERGESKLRPTYKDGEPGSIKNASEAGLGTPHEVDSGQALPHEVDSGQALPHEADSRHVNEFLEHIVMGQWKHAAVPRAWSGVCGSWGSALVAIRGMMCWRNGRRRKIHSGCQINTWHTFYTSNKRPDIMAHQFLCYISDGMSQLQAYIVALTPIVNVCHSIHLRASLMKYATTYAASCGSPSRFISSCRQSFIGLLIAHILTQAEVLRRQRFPVQEMSSAVIDRS